MLPEDIFTLKSQNLWWSDALWWRGGGDGLEFKVISNARGLALIHCTPHYNQSSIWIQRPHPFQPAVCRLRFSSQTTVSLPHYSYRCVCMQACNHHRVGLAGGNGTWTLLRCVIRWGVTVTEHWCAYLRVTCWGHSSAIWVSFMQLSNRAIPSMAAATNIGCLDEMDACLLSLCLAAVMQTDFRIHAWMWIIAH